MSADAKGNAATAFVGLIHHVGGVHPGQIILVEGGAGNVGSSVIQFAHTMSARIIATAHRHDGLILAVNILAHGGSLVVMAGIAQQPAFPEGPFYTRNAPAIGFAISSATVVQLAEAARADSQPLPIPVIARRGSSPFTPRVGPGQFERVIASAAIRRRNSP